MKPEMITSSRLTLIPMSLETCMAELEGKGSLSRVLHAHIPGSWPPPLMTEETIHEFISLLSDPAGEKLCSWYWVRSSHGGADQPVLIGSGGLYQKGDDSYDLGYSVLAEYQNKGYATEAVSELLDDLFLTGAIDEVYATTYPYLIPSIRVLAKCGFTFIGPGEEEGTIRFKKSGFGVTLS